MVAIVHSKIYAPPGRTVDVKIFVAGGGKKVVVALARVSVKPDAVVAAAEIPANVGIAGSPVDGELIRRPRRPDADVAGAAYIKTPCFYIHLVMIEILGYS